MVKILLFSNPTVATFIHFLNTSKSHYPDIDWRICHKKCEHTLGHEQVNIFLWFKDLYGKYNVELKLLSIIKPNIIYNTLLIKSEIVYWVLNLTKRDIKNVQEKKNDYNIFYVHTVLYRIMFFTAKEEQMFMKINLYIFLFFFSNFISNMISVLHMRTILFYVMR